MRQILVALTRNPRPRSRRLHGGFTIIETLVALSMVMLITHVILRAVPGIYKASAQAESLQLERSLWVSLGAEEWLESPEEERYIEVERETDRDGWLRVRPTAQAEHAPFWRGPIESVQQQPDEESSNDF